MKKLLRLLREAFAAFLSYRNFWVYWADRLGWLSGKEVVLRMRNGLAYTIHTNSSDVRILNEIWHMGIYDRFLGSLTPGANVIDIGAHVGIFSLKAATSAPDVTVASYEALPGNYEMLKKNIAANHLEDQIRAKNLGVMESRGTMTFYEREGNTGGGSFHPSATGERTKPVVIPTCPLADIFTEHRIARCDFLKIDCEGAEEAILYGASPELFPKIASMTIEWHDEFSRFGIEKFLAFLSGKGYAVEFDKETGTIYARRGR